MNQAASLAVITLVYGEDAWVVGKTPHKRQIFDRTSRGLDR